MARAAAQQAFAEAGLQRQDVDVLECHNCFSCNEASVLACGLVGLA